jgi:hypothetical protein
MSETLPNSDQIYLFLVEAKDLPGQHFTIFPEGDENNVWTMLQIMSTTNSGGGFQVYFEAALKEYPVSVTLDRWFYLFKGATPENKKFLMTYPPTGCNTSQIFQKIWEHFDTVFVEK